MSPLLSREMEHMVGEEVKRVCVCVLAHNEEKHISETVRTIVDGCATLSAEVKVYANGCSDATAAIVRDLSRTIPNLHLRELSMASKPNAWNTAFSENSHDILVFSDGDVVPEPGAISCLYQTLCKVDSQAVLVGCSVVPNPTSKLSLGQRVVGFLQMPLHEDFLSGAMYAVARKGMESILHALGLEGIPLGIVAEDTFLQSIVPPERFTLIDEKIFYEPPAIGDYSRYLARIRWQEEQLVQVYGELLTRHSVVKRDLASRISAKIRNSSDNYRLLVGGLALVCRSAAKLAFQTRIQKCYAALGPVSRDGRNILSDATRSRSAK